MFLRAGALSLALLLASRLLGVARESSLAAAFGSSGLADLAVLALSLPDWIASVLASGALAYVLLPAWAAQDSQAVAALQRRVAKALVGGGLVLALLLALSGGPLARGLAAGVPAAMQPLAVQALWWSAAAVPLALLASLWATRAQHERDFTGLYGANLVVNATLIAAIAAAGLSGSSPAAVWVLGLGLLAAMALRLLWLRLRLPAAADSAAHELTPPPAPVWLWAVLGAGLPLALPFAARSAASQAGEGALATFNYAWKLVELPLVLAIQLVASLAFPAIARALASGGGAKAAAPARQAFALAWTLACAAVAALAVGAPALARLLFGWGRMDPAALEQVWRWGLAGSWGLLPQAVAAVALTVLAARRKMRPAVAAYGAAFLLLLGAAAAGVSDGLLLMQVLNAGYTLVAVVCVAALGREGLAWLPGATMAWSAAGLAGVLAVRFALPASWRDGALLAPLLAAAFAAALLLLLTLWRSGDLRQALRR
jgi:peptidoglycan biosynthesis protein MviN/MurJ (putative lipid II flippase)